MPELPEVETVRRSLLPLLKDKIIKDVKIFYSPIIHSNIEEFVPSIKGKKILNIERKGKHLIFCLSDNLFLLSHLRMEGKYHYEKEENKYKHDLLCFLLNDNTYLYYNDVRKFGVFMLKKKDELWTTPPLSELGKEPFEMDLDNFYNSLKTQSKPIKEILLDQTFIAGIGNIYADEILIHSQISPLKKGKDITYQEASKMLDNARLILNEAIANGGSTIATFHPLKGIDGRMQNHLWAYGREGERCPLCGAKLRKIKLGGRGTTYCPSCQASPYEPYIVSVTGPIASGKSLISNYLSEHGYFLIDADKVAHSLYKKKEVQDVLKKHFGEEIMSNGEVNRAKLLEIVIQNNRKEELNSLILPRVYEALFMEIKKAKNRKIVLDIPLLFSSPFEKLSSIIILITAKKELQIERLKERGVDIHKSLSLNQSYPLKEALTKCDLHLESTSGPKENLINQLKEAKFLF